MKTALRKFGPLIVSLNADCISANNYQSGQIVNGSYSGALNHNALAVGYGHDATSGLDFYIVKNSWGNKWGSQNLAYFYNYIYSFKFQMKKETMVTLKSRGAIIRVV